MKEKKIPVELIPRTNKDGRTHEAYKIMDDLIANFHPRLAEARIAIAWNYNWKADVDGRLLLGKCKKASDLDRELHEYDFVVLLNEQVWSSADFKEKQKRALMDHELSHAEIKTDSDGEVSTDTKGRAVYRIRKHDIEEFRSVVQRHGLYKNDLVEFAKAILEKQRSPLLSGGDLPVVDLPLENNKK